MKIAFLMYDFIPRMGGTQIFAYNLINQLSAKNHDVHLYLPYKSYLKFKKSRDAKNYKVIPILRHEHFTAKYWPGLIRTRLLLAQKIQQYDIWQVIGAYPAGWVAKDLSKKVPVILRSHGDDIQKEETLDYGIGRNPKIDKRIKKTLSRMTRLIALTDTVKHCYRDYDIPENVISLIPNGVEVSRFNKKVNKEQLRKKFSVGETQKFILTVGRYHLKKGYEIIPEVCALLDRKGIDYKWLIVGTNVSKIEPIVKKYNVKNRLLLIDDPKINSFSNNVTKVPPESLIDLYLSSDLFVMPSLLETFGMVLIEAMAAGLPIVSTLAPGCRDVVKHQISGLLVEPNDPQKLLDSIIRIINDEYLKNKLIDGAMNQVKRYDWQTVSKQYEDLYKDILNA